MTADYRSSGIEEIGEAGHVKGARRFRRSFSEMGAAAQGYWHERPRRG